MSNPYVVLGLTREATTEEIRAAFNRRAKETHPDAGGNREEFEKARNAFELLINPARRKKFDETGMSEEDKLEQSLQAQAMGVLAGFAQSIVKAVATQASVKQSDMLKTFRDGVLMNINKNSELIAARQGEISKLDDVAERFVGKGSEIIKNVFLGRKQTLQVEIAKLQNTQRVLEMALALVKDCEFKFEPVLAPEGHFVFTVNQLDG